MTDPLQASPIARTRIEEIRERLLTAANWVQCYWNNVDLEHTLCEAADELKAQGRRIAALEQGEWLPIETAPKDGTDVLAFNGTEVNIAYCAADDGLWYDRNDLQLTFSTRRDVEYDWLPMRTPPTHWLPLPTGPQG